MLTLVTGGSGSGKSAYAEQIITELGGNTRIYIATMFPFDKESRKRVERHQRMRAEKCFTTIECYTGLKTVNIPSGAHVLLECMSNLTANEMFMDTGAGENTVDEIKKGIGELLFKAEEVVVVTNEIFSDGMEYDEETIRYQKYLGEINRFLAGRAGQVTEVVYGIPIPIKREGTGKIR